MMRSFAWRWFGLGAALCTISCGSKHASTTDRAAASEALPGGLTPELAAKVLARVDGRAITLGDYAAALDRMNELDRLRYQSPEKRRDLLQEIIDLELLSIEAKRRGLDKLPENEEAVRQVLRDALLADARRSLPSPAEIPEAEVRAYYDAHRSDYTEPERRRVSVIGFTSKAEAEATLPEARAADAQGWGRLALTRGEAKGVKSLQPLEMMGELGIVGPPGDAKGEHPRVTPEVRAAVFEISGDVGSVLDRVVASAGHFFLVKLSGKTPAHERPFAEAARSIRSLLLQQKMADQERELENELRKQIPVTIDEAALAKVHVPSEGAAPAGSSSAGNASVPSPSRGQAPPRP